jgi:hypothetical protein
MNEKERASRRAGEEAAAAVAETNAQAEGPAVDPRKSDPEEIRHDIEQTRQALGDTVEALSHKIDVKAQVRSKVNQRKQALRQRRQEAKAKSLKLGEEARERSAPIGMAAALAALLLVLLLVRRHRG